MLLPPFALAEAVPSFPPKQETSVLAVMETVIAEREVTVVLSEMVQLLASVTVTEKLPVEILFAVTPLCPFDHKKEYAVVPPLAFTVAEPSLLVGQETKVELITTESTVGSVTVPLAVDVQLELSVTVTV